VLWTHAPQSHALSFEHERIAQWCGSVDDGSQSVFSGHLNAPPTQSTGAQPWMSTFEPGTQANPVGHAYPSLEHFAGAQP